MILKIKYGRGDALVFLMVLTVMLTIAPKVAAVWSSLVIFRHCSSQTKVKDCELGSQALGEALWRNFCF